MSAGADEATIQRLLREGQNAEAAELCLRAGDAARAAELHAAVWDWEAAVRIAEDAGMLDLAYRHALASGDPVATARVLSALPSVPEQAQRAASYASDRGRPIDAARLQEALGDLDAAARSFEQGGETFEAARCHEATGRYREAGALYERRLREAPDDAEAALRLGRILAHFGRWEHAVRALQRAARDPDRAGGALRLMIACFAALGMDDAAASQLDVLRRADPTLPVTVPQFLLESFGDARGIAHVGIRADGTSAQSGDEPEGAARLLAGRYRVLRPLGSGATGRVLLAYDGFYDREVAVKVLTVGSSAAGRDAYVRFAREARIAAALDHPNVVRVFEFNADGPFLAMEHMAGGTLEDRLVAAGGRLPLGVVRHVATAVLRGLDAVHRRGVVHRDLKPANVFFGAAGDVKIGDFGVAHLADLGATLTGAMLGTLAYMAPEQITGEKKPDASTDLYALGVMLSRMLTGRLPFPGPDFVTQHLHDPPPLPSASTPVLGTTYDALIASLLGKTTAERPRSAAEVLETIEALPWIDPEEAAVVVAAPELASREAAAREERVSTIPPPPGEERYEPIDLLPSGATLARDRVLGRLVELVPCDEDRAARLRALARADSPFLQAVYSVDAQAGRAVVERPDGRPLASAAVDPERRSAVRAQIRAALARMHVEGVVHGAVDADHVFVGRGRAVLLLSDAPEGATAADDASGADAL